MAAIAMDRRTLDPLPTGFADGELAGPIALDHDLPTVRHGRDKDGITVDLVLARTCGDIVAVSAKVAETTPPGLQGTAESRTHPRRPVGPLHRPSRCERIQRVVPGLLATSVRLGREA